MLENTVFSSSTVILHQCKTISRWRCNNNTNVENMFNCEQHNSIYTKLTILTDKLTMKPKLTVFKYLRTLKNEFQGWYWLLWKICHKHQSSHCIQTSLKHEFTCTSKDYWCSIKSCINSRRCI